MNDKYISPVPHPLPLGTKVLSLGGEFDQLMDDEGNEVPGENHSGPNAVGEVIDVDYYHTGQGWAYTIKFPSITPRPEGSSEPQDVIVTIDQYARVKYPDTIDNPDFYRVLDLGDQPAKRKPGWPDEPQDVKVHPSMFQGTIL